MRQPIWIAMPKQMYKKRKTMKNIGKFILLFTIIGNACAAVDVEYPLIDAVGNTYGFETKDPDLYFLIPNEWRNDPVNTYIKKEDDKYFFYFIANPNYSPSLDKYVKNVGYEVGQTLLPMPYTTSSSEIYLYSDVGNLEFSVTRDENNFSAGESIYFKISMNQTQYEVFKQLANGGLALTGNLIYEYEGEFGPSQSAIPITVIADSSQFNQSPEQYELAWLKHVTKTTRLYLEGVIDGFYSLGIFGVNVENSLLECKFIDERYSLTRDTSSIILQSTNPDGDIDCSLTFYIPELAFNKHFSLRFEIDVKINLGLLSVEVLRLDPVEGSANDDFYFQIVELILDDPERMNDLSDELTESLRERILNHNLYFLIP